MTVYEVQGEVPSGRKDSTSTAGADRRRQGRDVAPLVRGTALVKFTKEIEALRVTAAVTARGHSPGRQLW